MNSQEMRLLLYIIKIETYQEIRVNINNKYWQRVNYASTTQNICIEEENK